MDLTIMNIILAFSAGLASILSPCVLPVVPIIVTGRENESRFRPLLIVAGLAVTFILMGILSSIFGSFIAGKMVYLEKGAGILILVFGLLMLADVNLFKYITVFNNISGNKPRTGGAIEGLILGLSLGLIWIPCVGPMLSSVLATVATSGKIVTGIILLSVYSAGFGIPMLIAGYAGSLFRDRFGGLKKFPGALRIVNAAVLVIFGLYILLHGMVGIGF